MECPDYIPLFPPSFSSPSFPITGLSSLHDQVRPLAHVVAAPSRPTPRHVPGHSLLDLVAKNSPRLALRRGLFRLLRTVLFRLHPVSRIPQAPTLNRHHPRRGAPFKPSFGLSGAISSASPTPSRVRIPDPIHPQFPLKQLGESLDPGTSALFINDNQVTT